MFRLRSTVSFAAGLGGAVLGVLTSACAGAPADLTAAEQQAVVGGTLSGTDDDAVVLVTSRQPAPYQAFACSGVLLAPNLLLTALHCAAEFDGSSAFACHDDGSLDSTLSGGWIGETLDPANIEVSFGNQPTSVIAARGLRVFGSGTTTICSDDVALVVLDTALPARGLAVRTRRPVVTGELMTVIGYGQNDLSDVPRARRSGIEVLDVGPDDTKNGLGNVPPRTFIVGDGPCLGDEGGPALSDETGAVTGVFAFHLGGGDCRQLGARGSFAEISPLTRLLRDAFAVAGGSLREETPGTEASPSRSTSCAFTPKPGQSGPLAGLSGALVALLVRRRSRAVRSGVGTRARWRREAERRRVFAP